MRHGIHIEKKIVPIFRLMKQVPRVIFDIKVEIIFFCLASTPRFNSPRHV